MSRPTTVFGKSPGSVEAIIESENARNGHVATIERYTIFSTAPPIGIATSKESWDNAYERFVDLFGEPNEATYKAKVLYAQSGSE